MFNNSNQGVRDVKNTKPTLENAVHCLSLSHYIETKSTKLYETG